MKHLFLLAIIFSIFLLIESKNLVMVGGGLSDDNTAIYSEIVSIAGGKQARIGIITAASDPQDAEENGIYYEDLFRRYGASSAEWIPIDLDHISNAQDPKIEATVLKQTGFFFGGGDQSRLITCFYRNNSDGTRRDTLVLAAIRKLYNSGSVIGGSSAGTAILVGSDSVGPLPMVTGGESYEALLDGPYKTGERPRSLDDLTYDPLGGFEFFNYGLLDTHFSERGRQGRIVRLAYWSNVQFAYGVDENSAIVLKNADTSSASMKILGESGAFIFDLRYAYKGSDRDWSLYNVSVAYLSPDDIYYPSTRTFQFASWKSPLTGKGRSETTYDIFSSPNNQGPNGRKYPREFPIIAIRLFESSDKSTYGYTYEDNPIWRVDLLKTTNSIAYQGRSPDTRVLSTSFHSLRMDIYPD